MQTWALVWVAIFGVCLWVLVQARHADHITRRAHRMLQQARNGPSEEADRLLAKCCAECARVVTNNPRHVFAWHVWGAALWCQGQRATDADADRLYAEAEDKYACALEIKPDDTKLTIDRFWVLWNRADLHPGYIGLNHLERICEECERLLILKPREARLLNFWGSALCCRGTRTSGPDADRLFAEAEEKLTTALAITPHDQEVMSSLANVLWRRAKLHHGEEAMDFLVRSGEWIEKALRAKPYDPRALSVRAWVLYARAKLLPGEETDRLLAEAASQFEAAGNGADGDTVRQAWGVVLWAQARSAAGEQSVRLLQAAKQKLAEVEAQQPESAAYNLACVCAQLGDPSECRQWLEKSREPGVLVSRDQMATEEELANVRDTDWFRRILG